MRLIPNTGTDRVIDLVRPWLKPGNHLDLATSSLSLFAFGELLDGLAKLAGVRLLLPAPGSDLDLLGSPAAQAAKRTQISRRVELSLQIKQLEAQLSTTIENLTRSNPQ